MSKEIDYLKKLINDVDYDTNKFIFPFDDNGKEIFGVFSPNTQMGRTFEYKTVFETILEVDWAVKISFLSAIDYEYINDDFNPLSPPTQNQRNAAYYTENGVFRTIVLWDMLAQLYNIKHKIETDTTKIFYKSFFKKRLINIDKINAGLISSYFEQDDNTDVEPWQGNHSYLNEFRNQMTHRNSPNISTMSNFAFEMRMPARYTLKRAIEDYSVVSKFITSFLDDIGTDDLLSFDSI